MVLVRRCMFSMSVISAWCVTDSTMLFCSSLHAPACLLAPSLPGAPSCALSIVVFCVFIIKPSNRRKPYKNKKALFMDIKLILKKAFDCYIYWLSLFVRFFYFFNLFSPYYFLIYNYCSQYLNFLFALLYFYLIVYELFPSFMRR